MIVGVPKEIKKDEYRIGLLPVGAELLSKDGHTVLVETMAGVNSGFDDWQYASVGAEIIQTPEEVYRRRTSSSRSRSRSPRRSPGSARASLCSATFTSPPPKI